MSTRTDVHAPSRLVPADYSLVMSFAYPGGEDPAYGMEELRALRESGRMFRKANGTGGCHVCGARFRYGSVFEHVSGEYIAVGWECAETIDCAGALGDSRAEVLSALRATRLHREALVEGRAVRQSFPDVVTGRVSRSVLVFPTRIQAELYLGTCQRHDIEAELLQVSLAEQAASLGLPEVPASWIEPSATR